MQTARRPRLPASRIYLNGFMGSGKSTLGPLVAERLNWEFWDLDELIVESMGEPIAEYFQRAGETAFRRIEAEQLRTTVERDRLVVAVGGGALCREANLEWALRNGLVIFLRVNAEELVRRLKAEQVTRPMLLEKDGSVMEDEVLERRIGALLAARERFYSRAHFTIEASNLPADEAVSQIVNWVEKKDKAGS